MRINLTSVYVHDQDKALRFYTEVLGFVKKTEIPFGDAKWLTVVSPQDPDGIELLLEPDKNPNIGRPQRISRKLFLMLEFPLLHSLLMTLRRSTGD